MSLRRNNRGKWGFEGLVSEPLKFVLISRGFKPGSEFNNGGESL